MSVKPIPEGYGTLTPYLIVKGAGKALDFYSKAFGAKELFRFPQPDGRIGHAEMQLGDSRFMLADEFPERDIRGPQGPPPVSLAIYTEDCDAMFNRALSLGAQVVRPIATQFYGDRTGVLADPFGHQWSIATHVEDVPPEELERRARAQRG